jgi:hypothetical protein
MGSTRCALGRGGLLPISTPIGEFRVWTKRGSVVQLDQPDVGARQRDGRHGVRLPRCRLSGVGLTPSRRSVDGAVLPPARHRRCDRHRCRGVVGIFVLRSDAEYLFDELTTRALPLVLISAVCGLGSLVLLVRDAPHGARLLAVGAVASVVIGWGVAQWPYILPETLEVEDAAAPSGTLTALWSPRSARSSSCSRVHPALRARSEEPAPRGGCQLMRTWGYDQANCPSPYMGASAQLGAWDERCD